MSTNATAASQARLASEIAVYEAIPAAKRTARQSAALATDKATYAKQQAALGSGSTLATPVQYTGGGGVFGQGPVAGGGLAAGSGADTLTGGSGASASGSKSSTWLLLVGGGAVLILLLMRK